MHVTFLFTREQKCSDFTWDRNDKTELRRGVQSSGWALLLPGSMWADGPKGLLRQELWVWVESPFCVPPAPEGGRFAQVLGSRGGGEERMLPPRTATPLSTNTFVPELPPLL